MKKLKITSVRIYILCVSLFFGCEEVIDVDVPDAGVRLVVDASMDNTYL